MKVLARRALAGPAWEVAPRLLNCLLVAADGRAGRIVEVEAYGGALDPASHAYRGPTARNATMFGPPGHLYVYFSYGVHWCANVVTGRVGEHSASAVLLRALAPVSGLERMRAARWRAQKVQRDRDLCRGPGRLAQAMGIDRSADGVDLCRPGAAFVLAGDGTAPPARPGISVRIGISVAKEQPWRFFVPGHPAVSGPRGAGNPPGRAEANRDSSVGPVRDRGA